MPLALALQVNGRALNSAPRGSSYHCSETKAPKLSGVKQPFYYPNNHTGQQFEQSMAGMACLFFPEALSCLRLQPGRV